MKTAALTALTILASFVAAVAATWVVRNWLKRQSVVDAPGDRSLHKHDTVTGGGLAISLVLVVLWICLRMNGVNLSPVLLLPVIAFTVIGMLDDIYNLYWLQKLSLQLAAAALFVILFGSFTKLEMFGFVVATEWLLAPVSVAWIVGFVNIYNFMDGIDGLAGSYGALCACVLGVWLALMGDPDAFLFLCGLMAACLGFLIWNWAPAKIFLGDTGSMMLGGTLATVSVMAQREHDIPLSAIVLLFAVFIGDTAYTLIRRGLRREKIWQAHREHLYQRAVRSGLTHSFVTGMILLISLVTCLFASLEMGRVGPRTLWLASSLAVLGLAMALVRKRELRRS